MNTQNPIVRRLLPLALACGLLAVAVTPAVQAQSLRDYSCGDLLVVISGSASSDVQVNCNSVYTTKYRPSTKSLSVKQSAVIILEQVFPSGVDCTISVTGGGNTAGLKVKQNYCVLEAGTITASVPYGNATLAGSAEGSYINKIPGIVWFNLGF
jgi:hypothetical protein